MKVAIYHVSENLWYDGFNDENPNKGLDQGFYFEKNVWHHVYMLIISSYDIERILQCFETGIMYNICLEMLY